MVRLKYTSLGSLPIVSLAWPHHYCYMLGHGEKFPHKKKNNGLATPRGQTTISAQGVIACSISAHDRKGSEQFTEFTGTGTFEVRSKAKYFKLIKKHMRYMSRY